MVLERRQILLQAAALTARFGDEHTYRHTRLPVDLASTLIPDAYCSPEFFAQEREKVFATGWVAVGLVADVDRPGRCVVVEVAGRSVVVTRNRDGELRGFHNVCPHGAGVIVWPGAGTAGNLVCRYHGWAYDWDGKLKSARDFGDEAELCPDDRTLTPISARSSSRSL